MNSQNSDTQKKQTRAYRSVQDMVWKGISKKVSHTSIANDIANDVLVNFMKEEVDSLNLEAWVHNKIEQHTESHISNLWQFCFTYALSLLSNDDIAKDVSQNVMIALLQSRKQVMYVRGWLKSAVYKQSMQYFQKLGKESVLESALLNNLQADVADFCDENELEESLSNREVYRLLKPEEFKTYKEFKKYPSVRAYAKANGMTNSRAYETKRKIMVNLKSRYLRSKGWLDSPVILDYRQMVNIKRFFDNLVQHAQNNDFTKAFHYSDNPMRPILKECFTGFKEVFDWGITILKDGSFEISVADFSDEENPIFILMVITFNKANYIKIVSCRKLTLWEVIPSEKICPIPMEKGTTTLELEDIKAYLQ